MSKSDEGCTVNFIISTLLVIKLIDKMSAWIAIMGAFLCHHDNRPIDSSEEFAIMVIGCEEADWWSVATY